MKRIFAFAIVVLLLTSCDPVDGNLVGVKGRDTFYPDILGPGKVPYGMVYIPSGAFQTGEDDKDIMGLHTTRSRTISLQAYYMDASEISNNEYRQFVNWVRDSIAREKLYRRQSGDDAEQWVNVPDDFFKERKLYPNVDFYSGVIYRAMGIPTDMFTVMFALGRLPGWIAHWIEMHRDGDGRIGRPRQIYMGETVRPYIPMDQRK